MTFGETVLLFWALDLLSSKDKPSEPERKKIDFEFKKPTVWGWRIGFSVFLASLIIAIFCLFTGHPFYAIFAFLVAYNGIVIPFIKIIKEEEE